jgi:hypothetical protein
MSSNSPSASPANSRLRTLKDSVLRSLGITRIRFLRQLWVRPLVAILVLSVPAYFVMRAMDRVLEGELKSNLQTILAADVAALRAWMTSEQKVAVTAAEDRGVSRLVSELATIARDQPDDGATLKAAAQHAELRTRLKHVLDTHGFGGFAILTSDGTMLSCSREELIGLKRDDPAIMESVKKAMQGEASVTRPHRSILVMPDTRGRLRAGLPSMLAIAPVFNADRKPVAAIGFRVPPEKDFSEILGIARIGQSGETYAFDRNGLLLSESRFDDGLRQVGLLTEDDDSILNVHLRDPQVNLADNERAPLPRSQQPLTYVAAQAVQGGSGVDVDGHRNYRGIPAVAAWTWLDQYDFGVATEVSQAEAYRPLTIIKMATRGMIGLLFAAAIALAIFTAISARNRRAAQKASLSALQLGQYSLEEKLGEGGMGVVYRAHHAMLRRPTAVKFLHPDKSSFESLARFEREVQLTSRLNHPNTIAVYDFGRSPEGIFYYAMEFLDGVSLEHLIGHCGALPDGRVIHILSQVCGSLAEAHEQGLIHRDIKPANIVINRRGGISDFVKVLDFGLAKAVDAGSVVKLTAAGMLAGTPLYSSPEMIQQPNTADPRSDLYAMGAVGYFLLTGQSVFEAESVVEVLKHHIETIPQVPSERLGRPVSRALEQLLLQCLAKDPDARPASAREICTRLAACIPLQPWTTEDADEWWQSWQSSGSPLPKFDDGMQHNETVIVQTTDG